MNFFELDQEFNLVVKDEVFTVPEFEALLDKDFNVGTIEDPNGKYRTRCFSILKYIYLMYSWKSPNREMMAKDRHELSLEQAAIPVEDLDLPQVIKAIKMFNLIQETRTSKMLDSVNRSIEKFRVYFDEIDLHEKDTSTGKPIFTVKELLGNIKELSAAYTSLEALEERVKKERSEKKALKGDAQPGMFDVVNFR